MLGLRQHNTTIVSSTNLRVHPHRCVLLAQLGTRNRRDWDRILLADALPNDLEVKRSGQTVVNLLITYHRVIDRKKSVVRTPTSTFLAERFFQPVQQSFALQEVRGHRVDATRLQCIFEVVFHRALQHQKVIQRRARSRVF